MTQGKHTPTPWHEAYRKRDDGMYSWDVYDSAGETIATMSWHPVPMDGGVYTDREANAEFIVRACNSYNPMLAALTLALECLERDGPASAAAVLNTHGRAAIASATPVKAERT